MHYDPVIIDVNSIETDKNAKEVIRAGLGEATSAIELSGGVIARSQESGGSRYVSNITNDLH
ncbi:MAG: hypothetical protein QXW12_04430 [Nitrososphaerota archaeon]